MKIRLALIFSITVLVAIILLGESSPTGFLGSDDFGIIVFFVLCGILALLYWAMRNMEADQRICICEYPIIPTSHEELVAHVTAALYADGFSKASFIMKVDNCTGVMFVKKSMNIYNVIVLPNIKKTIKHMEKRYMSAFNSALLHEYPDAHEKSISGRCILYVDQIDDNVSEMMKEGTVPVVFGSPYHIQMIICVSERENKLYMTKGHIMISKPFKKAKEHLLQLLGFLSIQGVFE